MTATSPFAEGCRDGQPDPASASQARSSARRLRLSPEARAIGDASRKAQGLGEHVEDESAAATAVAAMRDAKRSDGKPGAAA